MPSPRVRDLARSAKRGIPPAMNLRARKSPSWPPASPAHLENRSARLDRRDHDPRLESSNPWPRFNREAPRVAGSSIRRQILARLPRAAELNRAELSDRLISDEERRERRADRNDGRSAADSPPGIRFCKVRNLGQAVADPRIARSEGLSARAALSVGQPRGLHVHFRKHRVWRGALSSSHRVYFA